jgi:Asp-tRNA(Asn)/Glu-tRNA(Gln) amidotransferase A subunit family amidase
MLEAAARVLTDAGIVLENMTLPLQFGALARAQIDIMLYDLTRSLAYERLACNVQLSQRLRDMLDAGAAVTLDRYEAALHLAQVCRAALADIFSSCDVLLTPSAPGGAPSGLTATGDPIFNRVWTLLHVPCVSLPIASTVDGLPLGLQVVGNCRSDAQTLAAAHRLYQLLVLRG